MVEPFSGIAIDDTPIGSGLHWLEQWLAERAWTPSMWRPCQFDPILPDLASVLADLVPVCLAIVCKYWPARRCLLSICRGPVGLVKQGTMSKIDAAASLIDGMHFGQ